MIFGPLINIYPQGKGYLLESLSVCKNFKEGISTNLNSFIGNGPPIWFDVLSCKFVEN